MCRNVVLAFLFGPGLLFSESVLVAPAASVGNGLQTAAFITLNEHAPVDGVEITLLSSDPKRLLISNAPDRAGSGSLTGRVKQGIRESFELCLQVQGGE